MMVVLVYSLLKIILQQHNNFHWITMLLTFDIYGLGYSKVSNQVFVSKYFGESNPSFRQTTGSSTKLCTSSEIRLMTTRLYLLQTLRVWIFHFKIHQDCAGGFWVVDQLVIVEFYTLDGTKQLRMQWLDHPTLPRIVLPTSASLHHLNHYGIAMNSDCSIMWISDAYRILRFRAPFNSTSQPEGVLGQPDFSSVSPYLASASTFNFILRYAVWL